MTQIEKDGIGCLAIMCIAIVSVVAAVTINWVRESERTDGRTREQLVDRGLAEYVIVDAQTGDTEWRWKQ